MAPDVEGWPLAYGRSLIAGTTHAQRDSGTHSDRPIYGCWHSQEGRPHTTWLLMVRQQQREWRPMLRELATCVPALGARRTGYPRLTPHGRRAADALAMASKNRPIPPLATPPIQPHGRSPGHFPCMHDKAGGRRDFMPVLGKPLVPWALDRGDSSGCACHGAQETAEAAQGCRGPSRALLGAGHTWHAWNRSHCPIR